MQLRVCECLCRYMTSMVSNNRSRHESGVSVDLTIAFKINKILRIRHSSHRFSIWSRSHHIIAIMDATDIVDGQAAHIRSHQRSKDFLCECVYERCYASLGSPRRVRLEPTYSVCKMHFTMCPLCMSLVKHMYIRNRFFRTRCVSVSTRSLDAAVHCAPYADCGLPLKPFDRHASQLCWNPQDMIAHFIWS